MAQHFGWHTLQDSEIDWYWRNFTSGMSEQRAFLDGGRLRTLRGDKLSMTEGPCCSWQGHLECRRSHPAWTRSTCMTAYRKRDLLSSNAISPCHPADATVSAEICWSAVGSAYFFVQICSVPCMITCADRIGILVHHPLRPSSASF
jgi:hypothetical protein